MPAKYRSEEIGDLFVSKTELTVKLLPSKKCATRPIRWFAGGCVTNVKLAAKDISCLIGKLQGRTRVVRGLTVMTDRGIRHDVQKTGVPEAVSKAGFEVLK